MAKRYFNWKLATVLVITLVVLGVTAFGMRRWQRSRRAEQGLALGNKAYDEHRWQEAASNLGRHLAVEQDDVPILLKYADAQLNIRPLKPGNIQQAIGAYRNALRVDKNNSEAAMKLTEMYLSMGMPGEAELIASRYLEENQGPELRRILAVALAGQRKFEEAAAELKNLITEHPEQILAYDTLSQLAEQRPKDFSVDPNHWYDEAIKSNPSSALAYIVRGGFHLRNKDRPKALADLEQAEKQDLSDPAVRLRLATEFINANVLDKAEQHLTAAQMADPANQTLWQTWAQLALRSNSKTMMQKVARTGLEELSFQPWDFMLMATELYIRAGQLDRANECISELRQKEIAPAAVAFLEGLVANQKGQLSEAVICWRRAMELGDQSPQIRLALASALSLLGDLQSALWQLRILVSERPDFFMGHLALARLSAQTQNWAETAKHAGKAMQLSPENPEPALLYSQAQMQLLAANSTGENAPLWEDMDKYLAMLETASHGALEVKLLQFQLAMQQGNFADAEALVTELKNDPNNKAHPSKMKVAMAEVGLLTAQDKTEQAISILNNIVEQFPLELQPVRYLAILLAQQDEREKCERVIRDTWQRIEEDPNFAIHRKMGTLSVAQHRLCFLLADLYAQWGQEDKSYEFLTSLAGELPSDVPIKRRLLACKQVIEDTEKAQQLVDDIKSLEGEDGWQWRYEQAKVSFGAQDFKDRYPQIISLLEKNLLTNPDDQASRLLLAGTYERGGELQLAISTYRDALSRSPDDLRVIIPTVAALYTAKEYEQAKQILNRASREKLYHPELQRLQLQSHLRRGEFGSAANILESLLANDPNNQAVCLSLALLKMQQDEFDEADKLLAQLKAQDPNSLSVTVAQVQLNIRQNKSEEALKLCDEVVNDLNNVAAYVLRARAFASLGQADKAAEDLEHATALEPNNATTWAASSDFYGSIGRYDKAAADIQRALSLAPGNVLVQKRAISLFLASDNPDIAYQGRAILDKALSSNRGDSDLQLFKVHSLLAEGTAPAIETATRILQKITEDQPKISEAWVLLGRLALRQEQSGKAIDTALRGLVHRPNDKPLLLLKAQAEAERSPALAIPTLKVLRELDPNDVDAVVLLANTYIATEEPEKAVNLLRKQLLSCTVAADQRRINIALAVALHKNDSKKEAQEIFDSLYQSAPDDPRPLFAQARLLKEDKLWSQLKEMVSHWCQNHPNDTQTPITVAGDLTATEDNQAKKAAEDLLRNILDRHPNYLPAMNMLATLSQITARSEESVKLYKQILEREPNHVIAINNLAWILCEEQGKPQQALELTQRGLKIAPDYIDLIDTRGVVYYRLGKFNNAVDDFTRCIELYPARTPSAVASYFHLARALASLGQKHEAIQNLKKSLELNEDLKKSLESNDRIGGLSPKDVAEAQRLLDELSI